MADPTQQFGVEDFARGLRAKYPEFDAEPDDQVLVSAYLQVRPELKPHVRFTPVLPGDAGAPPSIGGRQTIPDPEPLRKSQGTTIHDSWPAVVPTMVYEGTKRAMRGAAGIAAMSPYGGKSIAPTPPPTWDALAMPFADVVGGSMEAGMVLLPGAMVTKPLVTGAALLTGIAGTEATRAGLSALDTVTPADGSPPHLAHPNLVDLASNIVGIVAGGAAAAKVHGRQVAGAEVRNAAIEREATATLAKRLQAEVTLAAATAAKQQSRDKAAFDFISNFESQRKTFEDAAGDAAMLLKAQQFNQSRPRGLQRYEGPPPSVEDVIGRTGGQPIRGRDVVPALEGSGRPIRVLPSDAPPPNLDVVGPEPPTIAYAPATNAPEPLVTQFGDQLEASLRRPVPQGPPRPVGALAERMRAKVAYTEAVNARRRDIAEKMSSELDEMPFISESYGTDPKTGESVYTPRTGGSQVYWDIVGDVKSPPTRSVVGDVVRVYVQTNGALPKDLPPAGQLPLSGKYNELVVGAGKTFRHAYTKWYSAVQKVIHDRARAEVAREQTYQARMAVEAERAANPPEDLSLKYSSLRGAGTRPELVPEYRGDPVPPELLGKGAPPVVRTEEPLPDFLRELGDDPSVQGAWEDGEIGAPPRAEIALLGEGAPPVIDAGSVEPRLPGLEATPGGAARTLAAVPEPRFDLTETPAAVPQQKSLPEVPSKVASALGARKLPPTDPNAPQKSFWDLAKSDEGMIVLNVKPGNARGLKDWIARHEEELGDEGWFTQARELAAAGDHKTAWRVAALGVGQANLAEGAAAIGVAADKRPQQSRAAATKEAIRGIPVEKVIASVEESLGDSLPHCTTIGVGGVVKLPGNPGHLDPKFTDMSLAKSLTTDLMKEIDAGSIVRVENEAGGLDQGFVAAHPEMRITAQMADQIVRDMPDYVLDTYKDLTGLDAAQLGAHFKRAFSNAGKLLYAAKQWQDENWDAILHLDPLTGATSGPGAAGRLEFIDPARAKMITSYLEGKRGELTADESMGVLSDLRRLTPVQRKQIGFRFPEGMEPESKQGKAYVSNWLRAQRQLVEVGRQVDAIASASDLDRTLIAAALDLKDTKGTARDTAYALMRSRLSFLISQSSTAIHVLFSQGAQYGLGIAEEAFAGVLAATKGDAVGAADHWRLAKNFSKGLTSKGAVPLGVAKHPTQDGIQVAFEYTRAMLDAGQFAGDDVRLALGQLENYPDIQRHLMGAMLEHTPMSGEKVHVPSNPIAKFLTSPKTANVLSVGMRLQEGAYRSTMFDAVLRAQIEAKGGDPAVILRMDDGLTQTYGEDEARRMFGAAAARALYGSQASNPMPGTVPHALLEFIGNWKDYPMIASAASLVAPFPRFQFTAGPRWLWDRMPGTLLVDIARWKIPLPAGKPRIQLGLEKVAIQREIIPRLQGELGRAEYDSAMAFGQRVQAQAEATLLKQRYKKLEARASKDDLPEIHDEIVQVLGDMRQRVADAQQAATNYTVAEAKVKDLRTALDGQNTKLAQLQEIAAPDWNEAIGRQAVGALLLAGGYALRAGQADDTKWSEVEIPGTRLRVDMKWTGPYAAYMMLGDLMHDVHKHTDWSAFAAAWDENKDERPYQRMTSAMRGAYTGKYTAQSAARDAAEAVLSLNGVLGGVSSLVDTLLMKESASSVLDAPLDFLLAFMGQSIGAFTFPLRQFGDVMGQFWDEEAKQRLPERVGPKGSAVKSLTDPVVENVPGLRQTITERIDPFTGGVRAQPAGALKPLAGLNAQTASLMQREINRTGTSYAKVSPRVTGDREFDNLVAKAYGRVLGEYLQEFLGSEEYRELPPQLARDRLTTAAGGWRTAAYAAVAEEIGETGPEDVQGRLLSPGVKAKRARWQRWLDRELADAGGVAGEPGGPPTAGADQSGLVEPVGAGEPPFVPQ